MAASLWKQKCSKDSEAFQSLHKDIEEKVKKATQDDTRVLNDLKTYLEIYSKLKAKGFQPKEKVFTETGVDSWPSLENYVDNTRVVFGVTKINPPSKNEAGNMKDGKPKRDPNAPKTKKSRKKLTDVSTKMLLQHGQSEFKIARYNSAILYFNKIYPTPREQETPKDYMLKGLVGRANSLIKLVKYSEALIDVKLAVKLFPTSAEALICQAKVLFDMGSFEHSLMFYQRVLKLRPNNKEAQIGKSVCTNIIKNFLNSRSNIFEKTDFFKYLHRIEQVTKMFTRTNMEETKDLNFVDLTISSLENEVLACPNTRTFSAVHSLKQHNKRLKKANQTLIGKLHDDQIFLQSLVSNPILSKSDLTDIGETTQDKITNLSKEALSFIDSRKKFWHKQMLIDA